MRADLKDVFAYEANQAMQRQQPLKSLLYDNTVLLLQRNINQ